MDLTPLLQDQIVRDFVINIAASIGWDAAKATCAQIQSFIAGGQNQNLKDTFDALAADEAICRSLRECCDDATKGLADELKVRVFNDSEMLVDSLLNFFRSPQPGGPPLSEQFRRRVREITAHDGLSDETIDRFVCATLTALTSGSIAGLVQLRATERVELKVDQLARRNEHLLSPLLPEVKSLREAVSASNSAVSDLLASQTAQFQAPPLRSELWLEQMGLSPGQKGTVDIRAFLSPPTLPPHFVRRATVSENISKRLAVRPILAVTGYPESGKTLALADFVRSPETNCVWVTLPSISDDLELRHIVLVALASYLGCGGALRDIETAIRDSTGDQPLILVIDNVELIQDISSLQSLFDFSDVNPQQFRVLLAYSESPQVTSSARLSQIPTYRLPGLEVHEAAELFQKLGVNITDVRLVAITMLRTYCDGHVGMLRLYRDLIESVKTESDLAKLPERGLHTSDASVFLDALLNNFMQLLEPHEHELCRRLSITVYGFKRSVAETLWSFDRDIADFHRCWQRCAAGIFEVIAPDRYSLPYLYQRGLQAQINEQEGRSFHAITAEHLRSSLKGVISFDDIYAIIYHYLKAEQSQGAIDIAGHFLFSAFHDGRQDILRVLIPGTRWLLPDRVISANVPLTSRIRFYALLMLTAQFIEETEIASRCATKLQLLLADVSIGEVPNSLVGLAWFQLLSYASRSGKPELAVRSLDAIPDEWAAKAFGSNDSAPIVMVAFAFLNSHASRELLEEVTKRVASGRVSGEQLWDEAHGFDFWRAVGSDIYTALDKLNASQPTSVGREIDRLIEFSNQMLAAGADNIAAIIGNIAVVSTIDLARDFDLAIKTARELAERFKPTDRRCEALIRHTLGDALRCGEQNTAAEPEYRLAVSLWPSEMRYDLSQSYLSLAVSLARCNRHNEAIENVRRALRAWKPSGATNFSYSARLLCEAAIIAMRAGRLRHSLVWLFRAREIMRANQLNDREWPLIGQLAMLLADHAAGKLSAEELPTSGYTFALPKVFPGAENMVDTGPEIALARACNALKFHRKAVELSEECYEALTEDSVRQMQAVLSFDFAIPTGDLITVVRGAGRALIGDVPQPSDAPELDYNAFLRDYVVARAVELVVSRVGENDAVALLGTAIEQLAVVKSDRPLYRLLVMSLKGIESSLTGKSDEALEAAYALACSLQARSVARFLCWFWCFRVIWRRREVAPADMVWWQWRLSWLTIAISNSDSVFLAEFLRQIHVCWKDLKVPPAFSELQDSILTISPDGSRDALTRLYEIEEKLAFASCSAKGYADFLPELIHRLTGPRPRWLADLTHSVVGQVFNWMLSPVSSDVNSQIQASLEGIANAVVTAADEPALDSARMAIPNLRIVQRDIASQHFTVEGVHALLGLRDFHKYLKGYSAANWLLALWEGAKRIDDPQAISSLGLSDYFTLENIEGFIESHKELPPGAVNRLRFIALSELAQRTLAQLRDAVGLLDLQNRMRGLPINMQAVTDARRSFEDCLAELRKLDELLVKYLDEVVSGDDTELKWSWNFLRGHSALQTALYRKQIGNSKETLGQFGTAKEALSQALKFAKKMIDSQKVAITAVGLTGASIALKEPDSTDTYRTLAKEAASQCSNDYLKDIENSLALTEQLYGGAWRDNEYREYDDADIASLADRIMASTGLPEDRRGNVLDDLFKIERGKKNQQTFCRHLQPLQNLEHTRHPHTAYSRPTVYTCECTLLGYTTQIEVEDIDTAVAAMQRTYCDQCTQRNPGNAE